jgi:hypothetical protein
VLKRFLCWLGRHDWSQWSFPVQNIPGVVEGGDGFPGKRSCDRPGCGAVEIEK